MTLAAPFFSPQKKAGHPCIPFISGHECMLSIREHEGICKFKFLMNNFARLVLTFNPWMMPLQWSWGVALSIVTIRPLYRLFSSLRFEPAHKLNPKLRAKSATIIQDKFSFFMMTSTHSITIFPISTPLDNNSSNIEWGGVHQQFFHFQSLLKFTLWDHQLEKLQNTNFISGSNWCQLHMDATNAISK